MRVYYCMSEQKNRVLFIDYIKAIAMILVIMGHVNFANQGIKEWIYSFHMPAFFFCTGLVITGGANLGSVLRKRFQRLMIPYLLWGLIFAKFTIPNLGKIVYGSYWSIVSSGALSSLWFLPVMFVSLLMFHFIEGVRLCKRSITMLMLIVFAFVIGAFMPPIKIGYPWAINVAFVAYGFLLVGFLLKKYIRHYYDFLKLHRMHGLCTCLIISLFSFVGTLAYQFIHPNTGYVLMANARWGNMPLFVFVALCGSFMLLTFSIFFEIMCKREIRLLSFVGQNTLCIFAVQKPIIGCFKSFFSYIHMYDASVLLILTTIGTLMLSCFLCIIINKFFPFLAGRTN